MGKHALSMPLSCRFSCPPLVVAFAPPTSQSYPELSLPFSVLCRQVPACNFALRLIGVNFALIARRWGKKGVAGEGVLKHEVTSVSFEHCAVLL